MDALGFARQQLIQARAYTNNLLTHTETSQWFSQPAGVPTHLAWQVGHLAMAQFRLCIFFVRPTLPEDYAVISDEFMSHFRKGTVPLADPVSYPPIDEIRRTFDAIHEHILASWSQYADIDLNEATCHPSPIAASKFDALTWAARHEMVHAGQIALLRRMLGGDPLW